MKVFNVYQQRTPRGDKKGEYHANIHKVGEVEAHSGNHALEITKQWPAFKRGRGLGRWPIVDLKTMQEMTVFLA